LKKEYKWYCCFDSSATQTFKMYLTNILYFIIPLSVSKLPAVKYGAFEKYESTALNEAQVLGSLSQINRSSDSP